MHSISENIKIILEEFIKKHSVIENLPDKEIVRDNNRVGTHLKTMSPRSLYRAKGLNITSYHKIMNKYGLPGHEVKPKTNI